MEFLQSLLRRHFEGKPGWYHKLSAVVICNTHAQTQSRPQGFPLKPCNEVVKDDSVSSGLSIKRVTFTLKALKPCPCQHFATIGNKNSWDTFPKRSFREVFLTSTVLPQKKVFHPLTSPSNVELLFELHGRDNKRPNLKFEGEGCRLFCCRL